MTSHDDAVVDVIAPHIHVVKTLNATWTPTVGTTVSFHIKVTNDGDTTLSNIVVTDANAPGCARNPLKGGTDGNTGAAITLAPNASAEYDCTLANVPITFSGNTAEACGTDTLGQTVCDDDTVPVTPQPAHPTVTTNAGPTVRLDPLIGNDLTDSATLSGGYNITGKIVFHLYRGANCDPANEVTPGSPVQTTVSGNGPYTSPAIHVTVGGQYHWIANYDPDGDPNNVATSNACNGTDENVFVIDPAIKITKTTSTPTIETGGTASFHIKVRTRATRR